MVQGPPEGFTPDSSAWLGAWWLGYVLTFAFGLLLFLPIMCYPKYLPNTAHIRRDKKQSNEVVTRLASAIAVAEAEAHTARARTASSRRPSRPPSRPASHLSSLPSPFSSSRKASHDVVTRDGVWGGWGVWGASVVGSVKAGLLAVGNVLNGLRTFNILGAASEMCVTSALALYLPLVIESTLGLTAAQTGFLFGATVVLGGASGLLTGGFLNSRLRMDGVRSARFCVIAALVSLPFTASFLLLNCPSPTVHGWTNPSLGEGVGEGAGEGAGGVAGAGGLSDACNAGCGCAADSPNLVCLNGETFYSLCHAGCELGGAAASHSNVTNATMAWAEADGHMAGLTCACVEGVCSGGEHTALVKSRPPQQPRLRRQEIIVWSPEKKGK